MSETPKWTPPEPLIDFHGLQQPDSDSLDPARSFEIVGPAACRRASDGAELYLSAGESELLSRLREGGITVDGLSEPLRHANRLAMAGLIEVMHDQRTSIRLHPHAAVRDLREHTTDQVFVAGPSRPRQSRQAELRLKGYVLTSDQEIGLSHPGFSATDHIKGKYFGELKTYPEDVPADRKRITGLICAHWILGGLSFGPEGDPRELSQRLDLQQSPHSTVAKFDDDNSGPRPEYAWHDMLHDPVLSNLYRETMFTLEKESREPSTTIGAHIFETFSDVVTRGHSDGGVLNVLYCIYANGGTDGSWTYVLEPGTSTPEGVVTYKECPLFAGRLYEGQVLLIADDKVGHYSTPNTPRFPGDKPSRGMVVLTVNQGKTYEDQLRYPYTDFARRLVTH